MCESSGCFKKINKRNESSLFQKNDCFKKNESLFFSKWSKKDGRNAMSLSALSIRTTVFGTQDTHLASQWCRFECLNFAPPTPAPPNAPNVVPEEKVQTIEGCQRKNTLTVLEKYNSMLEKKI